MTPEDKVEHTAAEAAIRYHQLQRIQQTTTLAAQREVRELLALPHYENPLRLERYGFKVFSQNDEDGIIQEIFRRIGTTNRTFFEFGCGNGLESNCCYLLLQGWEGVWVDAIAERVREIHQRFASKINAGRLRAGHAMLDRGNLNAFIEGAKLPADLDLLSIDIDGNDYYLFEKMKLRPRVVVIEYNASFPPPVKLVQSYDPARAWNSTNYFGASLQSLAELGASKGYELVGTNLAGVNAFFVRKDLWMVDCPGRFAQSPDLLHLYNPPRFLLGELGYPTGHPPDVGPYEVLP